MQTLVCVELYQRLIELERIFILPLAPRWVRHSYLSKRLHTIPYNCGISAVLAGGAVVSMDCSFSLTDMVLGGEVAACGVSRLWLRGLSPFCLAIVTPRGTGHGEELVLNFITSNSI